MNQADLPLLNALQTQASRPYAPFHTPGHKQGRGAPPELVALLSTQGLRADLPELPELDNLFAPQGPILAAQELAAEAFGADQTWFLANGSTSGVIAAIAATCGPGDRLILPRNVHQSAIAGLVVSGATPVFVAPVYDPAQDLAYGLDPEAIAQALVDHPQTKAVLIVSPTYEGVCADVAAIAAIAHRHGVPLIVDEAHGPHFAFYPELPPSALAAGADLVIQSTHKILSALTQAAMLHLRGDRVMPRRISQALQLVQSTSPNYWLLASLDAARHQMATEGPARMAAAIALARRAREQLQALPGLSLLEPPPVPQPGFAALDLTRITVDVTQWGFDGFAADQRLHEAFGVTAELPTLRRLTFLVTLGNTAADIEALVQGFRYLAAEASAPLVPAPWQPLEADGPLARSPREAFFGSQTTVPLAEAVGTISAATVCPYPPGIPVLLPGERITPAAVRLVQEVLAAGGFVTGCGEAAEPRVNVLQESV